MGLVIHEELLNEENCERLVNICPFKAITYSNGKLDINAACKLCRMCVNKGPKGVITYEEDKKEIKLNKDEYKPICIYCDNEYGNIHPVTFELIGKAKKLASVNNVEVIVVVIGFDLNKNANELLEYGVDKVVCYDDGLLVHFDVQRYTECFSDFIDNFKPNTILFGATNIGKSLAPRLAARYHTGLTADCTKLEMKENSDLVQIRPAFGGNIMAQIINPNNRPQFATVRYKIFDAAKKEEIKGTIINRKIREERLNSYVDVIEVIKKPKVMDISNSEVIVAVGRGLKSKNDLGMIEELAELLNGNIACTRPLVEAKLFNSSNQIGLSGKSVKPKLIICIGISGSVQFSAGMKNSDTIIAINNDPHAPIFDIANYGIVGDLYEVVPELIKLIKEEKNV